MSSRHALAVLCLAPLAACTTFGGGPATPDVPAALAVAANEKLVLVTPAKGAQIYECRVKAGTKGSYEWVFVAPDADLFDPDGKKFGVHYVGPSWEIREGGKVVGEVRAKVDSPDGKAIPWLLLKATTHEGEGLLTTVSSIQRLDTRGGLAPSGKDCTRKSAGKKVRVDYTATYYFYAAS